MSPRSPNGSNHDGKDWHMRTAVKDALEVYDIPLWRLIDETGSVRHLFFLCRLRAHSLRSSYS